MTEIARLAAAIKTISELYLTAEVKAGDRPAIQKWSLRLADYSTRLAALVAPPLTLKEAADLGEEPKYDHVLTYDEEHEILVNAMDKLLIEQGKPAGHDGGERGTLPLFTLIQMADDLGLPLHAAELRTMIVPDAAQ